MNPKDLLADSAEARRTVEAFVLDQEADLYGQHVAVDFVERAARAGERGEVVHSWLGRACPPAHPGPRRGGRLHL